MPRQEKILARHAFTPWKPVWGAPGVGERGLGKAPYLLAPESLVI